MLVERLLVSVGILAFFGGIPRTAGRKSRAWVQFPCHLLGESEKTFSDGMQQGPVGSILVRPAQCWSWWDFQYTLSCSWVVVRFHAEHPPSEWNKPTYRIILEFVWKTGGEVWRPIDKTQEAKMVNIGSRVHLRTRDASYDTATVTRYKKGHSISVRYMKSRKWDPEAGIMAEDWRTDDVAWKRIERLVEIL